jgi:hypothetical protein
MGHRWHRTSRRIFISLWKENDNHEFCRSYLVHKRIMSAVNRVGRPQWPGGLRRELSSLARKLTSWLRVALKGMDVWCVRLFCVCVILCVGSGLVTS